MEDTIIPRTATEVRSFLGLVSYYSKFIDHFAEIAQPLYDAIKGKVTYVNLQPPAIEVFNKLKSVIAEDVVLHMPNFELPFTVNADASKCVCKPKFNGFQNRISYNGEGMSGNYLRPS